MKRFGLLAFLALFAISAASAASLKAGDLTIEKAWSRATPKGAAVGAGYLTIRNDGANADRLLSVTADFATVQMHEMSMDGSVMKMRELKDGLEIPAHGSVTFKPGADHLMFVGLKTPLSEGAIARATLNFEHAGAVPVEFAVRAIGAAGDP